MMDKKSGLCSCSFCGVAYGTSLFFGEPGKKAKEALVKREFNEADQRYSYMLMIDPHDFEALRGRVLCAAKWTSPKVETDISTFWVNNLRPHVEYAFQNSLEKDKPYFKKYIEMMKGYSAVLADENKVKALKKKRDHLVYKRNHIVVDYSYDSEGNRIPQPEYAFDTITITISETENQIDIATHKRDTHLNWVRDLCSQIHEMDKEWVIRKAQAQKGEDSKGSASPM